MVAALPVMGAVLAEAAAPGLIARTASSPLGVGVLAVSVAMQVLGIVIIRRMAAIAP
jgi:Flp pilus assembly protein TadB